MHTLLSRKNVQSFSKKNSNPVVFGVRQSFQFLRQKTWFLENNRALPKLHMGLCITELLLSSHDKISPYKNSFILTRKSP